MAPCHGGFMKYLLELKVFGGLPFHSIKQHCLVGVLKSICLWVYHYFLVKW